MNSSHEISIRYFESKPFFNLLAALQCYKCPYKYYNLSTSNPQTCVKGYKGILQVCDEDMKDPRCVSSITENHPNLTLRGCWSAEKLPSDIECGVMKFYDTIQKLGEGQVIFACVTVMDVFQHQNQRNHFQTGFTTRNTISKLWLFLSIKGSSYCKNSISV
ncbi:unnamed protein product [Orchesella dallaii]|uniref:Uncharacterized protein n=1 Tax=Orchesella dallaii TaxID=48710 RepID=A0ABP1Q5D9_9HEXA